MKRTALILAMLALGALSGYSAASGPQTRIDSLVIGDPAGPHITLSAGKDGAFIDLYGPGKKHISAFSARGQAGIAGYVGPDLKQTFGLGNLDHGPGSIVVLDPETGKVAD